MKIFLMPELVCECGSHLYREQRGQHMAFACVSMACADYGIFKLVKCIEIPHTISPTKAEVVYQNLDLGEQEHQRQQEQEKLLRKEHRQLNDMRMFSG